MMKMNKNSEIMKSVFRIVEILLDELDIRYSIYETERPHLFLDEILTIFLETETAIFAERSGDP